MRALLSLIAILFLVAACGSDSKHSVTIDIDNDDYLGSGFSYTVWTIAPAADGSGDFYVGGQFTYFSGYRVNGIVRLNADGSIDKTFDMGSGFNNTVVAITPATDGSGDIYVGGLFTSYQGVTANRIIRLNSDGSIDAGFNSGNGFDELVYTISEAQDASGDIYVGGDFSLFDGNSAVRVARLNSDGSFDAGFNVGSGATHVVKTIAVESVMGSDRIYIGGDFTAFNSIASSAIARLLDDGSYDGSFSVGTGFDDDVETLALANDGSGDLYVGGKFMNYDSNATSRIARLNSNGSFDAAFATSAGFNSTVYDLAADPGTPGQLFAAGAFTTYDGNFHYAIACLNSVGFVCSGFNSGKGFSYITLVLAFTNDGSGDLLVGGEFFYYQGDRHNRLARLTSSGSAY